MSRGRYVKGWEIDLVDRQTQWMDDRIIKLEAAANAVLPAAWEGLRVAQYEAEAQEWQRAIDTLLIMLGPEKEGDDDQPDPDQVWQQTNDS